MNVRGPTRLRRAVTLETVSNMGRGGSSLATVTSEGYYPPPRGGGAVVLTRTAASPRSLSTRQLHRLGEGPSDDSDGRWGAGTDSRPVRRGSPPTESVAPVLAASDCRQRT